MNIFVNECIIMNILLNFNYIYIYEDIFECL